MPLRKIRHTKRILRLGSLSLLGIYKPELTNFIRFRMMRMDEHGLQDRENSRMYTKKPRCIGQAGKFITASLVRKTKTIKNEIEKNSLKC